MNQVTILVVVYILGLLFAAVFLDLWGSETGPKALIGMIWTALFAISLYYLEFKNK